VLIFRGTALISAEEFLENQRGRILAKFSFLPVGTLSILLSTSVTSLIFFEVLENLRGRILSERWVFGMCEKT